MSRENIPKRPICPFVRWSIEFRQVIRELHPHLKGAEMSRELQDSELSCP